METLLLAAGLGLFTKEGVAGFLNPDRMQSARSAYLKGLIDNPNLKQREENWRLHCADHDFDLRLAREGRHHDLLVANAPHHQPVGYYASGYSKFRRHRMPIIQKLQTARLKTFEPNRPGHIEQTVILPGPDDMVMDETTPGKGTTAPGIQFFSVDIHAPGGVDDLIRQLKREVQKLHKEEYRGRGIGAGRSRNLARMFEALTLYEAHRQSRRQELHWLGKKALMFGPKKAPYDTKAHVGRGRVITDLAEKMILTALLPTHDDPWTRTFL
jgi:hypothetical protein